MLLKIDYARPNLEGLGQDVMPVKNQIDAAYMVHKWSVATKLELLCATLITEDGTRIEGYPEREV